LNTYNPEAGEAQPPDSEHKRHFVQTNAAAGRNQRFGMLMKRPRALSRQLSALSTKEILWSSDWYHI